MKKLTFFADDKIPFLKGVLENVANVIYMQGNKISNTDIQKADALLIRTRTKCDKSLLKNSTVKFIASATIGYDHIDTEYCKKNNILWTNAAGCNSASVEQYVVSALLVLAQRMNFDLRDKVFGIVGVGHVGSKVAKAASALGMRILLNDPPRKRNENLEKFIDLSTIQKEADIISFHVPLNRDGEDKTLNIADKQFFKKLKKGTLLINTARGEIIDENALENAIDQKIIGATVLDVWRNEPSINLNLLKKASITTPHIAGYSAEGKAKGTEMSVQALSAFFKLSLSDWTPDNIPKPKMPILKINCQNKSEQRIISEAYMHTYNVTTDNHNLREYPESFELLRGEYPIRREAKAYTILLINNISTKLENSLKKLGFKLK